MFYSNDEKANIVELISKSSKPVKEACKEYGISDAIYYNWRKQLPARGSTESAPVKEQYFEDAEAKLLSLKNEQPYYGAVKLSKQLLRTYRMNLHPGKVKRILDEHGFKQEQIPKVPPKGTRRFERINPNELWMMDIMYYRLKKEGRFYLVSILDDYSRFIVAHRVCSTQAAENVTSVFQEAAENFGLPNPTL